MRKIFIFFALFSSIIVLSHAQQINDCKTDIYYGNGVWNEYEDADDSRDKLEKRIFEIGIIKDDLLKKSKYSTVKLQYNFGRGYMEDVLETYYQLKKAGQVNDLEFFAVMMILTRGNIPLSTYATAALIENMPYTAQVEQINVNIMLEKYAKESFDLGHRVLLVSHSQGNLFANRIYDSLNFKGYFSNVQVASPANKVHTANGMYVTGFVDPVINPIPGSMTSNADIDFPGGHAFVEAYLDSFDTYGKILEGIKKQLKNLDDTFGCECSNKPSVPLVTHNGAIEITLSWDHQCDIDMDLEMTGSPAIVHDVKDVEEVGQEHAYIGSNYQIFPGDHYDFSATGEELPDSSLNVDDLDTDPIQIRALLQTPTGAYFKVWEAQDLGQLNIGKFAELDVEEVITPKWVCPALNYTPGWYNLYNHDTGSFDCVQCSEPYSIAWSKPNDNYAGHWQCNGPKSPKGESGETTASRTYNQCEEEEKKDSCGCVPCDYIVAGMERRVENGPITGAKVEIIKVSDSDVVNPPVLFRGETTDDEDIFKSGLIEIPRDTLDQFEDEVYYLVSAKGGSDIDRDDDMARDLTPTENHGTIHALIKGSELKQLPFRINILTEAIYQVSGDVTGSHYDAAALESKLDNLAVKMLNRKLYPGDNDTGINYKDVLLWTPAVDKKALYKPFGQYAEPIIEKLYNDSARFDESYHLIYASYDSEAPQLAPLSLEIPEGLANKTIIAEIKTQNSKSFTSLVLTGRYAEHFSLGNDGYLRIANTENIKEFNNYRFQLSAMDEEGRKGTGVSLDIKVTGAMRQADPGTSTPVLVSMETFDIEENTPEGTKAAQVYFEDSNQSIIGYRLGGEDSSLFAVDNQGIVTVAADADIDYERSPLYHLTVSAYNDAGNESYPVSITISVHNLLDTPLFDLVFFKHVMENTDLDTVIGTVEAAREGLGDIEKFEILSPHMPFQIDANGTVRVAGFIDYEQVKKYDFYAIARTRYGNSNKVEFHIVVDDQEPEVGLPVMEDTTLSVDETVAGGTAIGQLNLDHGAEPVTQIVLYGENENFRMDSNGTLYLANNAQFDYETKQRYDLGVRALNSRGYGNEAHVVVHINNIADELPTLRPLRTSVKENVAEGTIVGSIQIGSSAEVTIDTILLNGEGSENFRVEPDGTIYVSSNAQLDYENQKSYVLEAVSSSEDGYTSETEVIIEVQDVADVVPTLKPFDISVEERYTHAGMVIGTIEVEDTGDTPIYAFDLNETEFFTVDNNGTLALKSALAWGQRSLYQLQITASNEAGQSEAVVGQIALLRNDYVGNETAEQFTGTQRDETFDAGSGDDRIDAGAGDDVLTGGRGNDLLYGGSGDDVYMYKIGDGEDEIYDISGNDTLKFLDNIRQEDILIERDSDDLLIALKDGDKLFNNLADKIRIKKWFNYENRIEHIEFSDGSKMEVSDILAIERDAHSEKYLFTDNEHFYYFYNVEISTWIKAKNFCEERGLYLTTITSKEESAFIEKHIKNSQNYWLGATDSLLENDWRWITNEIWSYTNWNSGEPNNLYNEDFLEFYGATYKWNDLKNTQMLFPLCEMNNTEIMILNIENFENNANGWSVIKRESGNELSTFLGRFGGSDGEESIEKTYHFDSQYAEGKITIALDIYKIDSWDEQTEKLQLFLDHMLVIDDIYAEDSKYGVTTTNNEFDQPGSELIYHYEIDTFLDENGDVTLGFGSTIDQDVDGGSYGIDNIVIMLK